MGTTQYVGARYLPIVADPIEWDKTREYESLTIVQYLGDTYSSKRYVPAGVEIGDTKYWFLVANFNAQIEAYRNEVRQFDGRISDNAAKIAQEILDRMQADEDLHSQIDLVREDLHSQIDLVRSDLDKKVTTETDERIDADDELSAKIEAATQKDIVGFPKNTYYGATTQAPGFCGVVMSGGKTMMIDSNADGYIDGIRAYMNKIGATKLDAIVVSHYHSDHCANFTALLSEYATPDTVMYLPKLPKNTNIDGYANIKRLYDIFAALPYKKIYPSNDSYTFGNFTMKFMNSLESDYTYYDNANETYNTYSMVVELSGFNGRTLYTSDITTTAQARLVSQGLIRHADVCVIPHHGYDRTNDNDFLLTVMPEVSILPTTSSFLSVNDGTGTAESWDGYGASQSNFSNVWSHHGSLYMLGNGAVTITNDGLSSDANSIVVTKARGRYLNYAATINVDVSKSTQSPNGAAQAPYNSLAAALASLPTKSGVTYSVVVKGGRCDESVTIDNMLNIIYLTTEGNSTVREIFIRNTPELWIDVVTCDKFTAQHSTCFGKNLTVTGSVARAFTLDSSNMYLTSSNATLTLDGSTESGGAYAGGGVYLFAGSALHVVNANISNKNTAIILSYTSKCSIQKLSGTNNTYGWAVYGASQLFIANGANFTAPTNKYVADIESSSVVGGYTPSSK